MFGGDGRRGSETPPYRTAWAHCHAPLRNGEGRAGGWLLPYGDDGTRGGGCPASGSGRSRGLGGLGFGTNPPEADRSTEGTKTDEDLAGLRDDPDFRRLVGLDEEGEGAGDG